MAKPLSQEEIDVLLNVRSELSGGDEYDVAQIESMVAADAGKRVNPYNFKRPRLFAQDQMRVLSHVHEAFARDLAVYLSAQLRTIVEINLSAIDQVLYSEFVMSSAPPSALYVVDVEGPKHQIVFELDPRLVIFTIEKLFGGPGNFMRKPREVSLIERRVMSKVMEPAYREFEKAWAKVFEMSVHESTFESNAEFVQIIPGVEPAFVGTFEVVIYDQRSFINICYPYRLLERALGRTGMKQWVSAATSEVDHETRHRYEGTLRTVDVEMRAELGRTMLPLSELMSLEEGDVIPLKRRITEPVTVFVDNERKFAAAPGRSGKNRALRILNRLEKKSDSEDDEHE